jgi:hypothetical protein
MESKEKKTEAVKVIDINEANDESVNQICCPDLENKFVLVRVGDEHRPATEEDIDEITEKLETMFDENGISCLTLVTHHAVSIEIIEKKGI